MLLILNIIISLTAVVCCGTHMIPSCCLIAKGVNAASESGNTENDIKGDVKEHVFGKWVLPLVMQGYEVKLQSLYP